MHAGYALLLGVSVVSAAPPPSDCYSDLLAGLATFYGHVDMPEPSSSNCSCTDPKCLCESDEGLNLHVGESYNLFSGVITGVISYAPWDGSVNITNIKCRKGKLDKFGFYHKGEVSFNVTPPSGKPYAVKGDWWPGYHGGQLNGTGLLGPKFGGADVYAFCGTNAPPPHGCTTDDIPIPNQNCSSYQGQSACLDTRQIDFGPTCVWDYPSSTCVPDTPCSNRSYERCPCEFTTCRGADSGFDCGSTTCYWNSRSASCRGPSQEICSPTHNPDKAHCLADGCSWNKVCEPHQGGECWWQCGLAPPDASQCQVDKCGKQGAYCEKDQDCCGAHGRCVITGDVKTANYCQNQTGVVQGIVV